MSITLYDILFLVGLYVLGPDSPYLIDDSAAPILTPPRYCYPSYRAVVREWGAKTDIPSATKRTMFLWVLIYHYIFCPSSGRLSSKYLPLACSLITDRLYNLGIMLLGSLYRNLNQCVNLDPISKLGGVCWFLQIWAFAYFSGIADFLVAPPTMLIATALMGSRLSMYAPDFIAYLQRLTVGDLSLPLLPNTHYLTQPLWVTSYLDFQDHSCNSCYSFDPVHPSSFFDCRLLLDPSSYDNSSWSFEFYNPSLYAYQFGLITLIPYPVLSGGY